MADANATTGAVCYHCNQSLTRPDIKIRTSPIHTMFGCGGLAPFQTTLVNETVSATLVDISELDREISRFRAAIEELELKRTVLQSFANVQKSLLNPISRLPAEVLSHIFQLCVIVPWTDSDIQRSSYSGNNKTPMAISSVSRPWRDVALSTPRLWSAISLVLRPKDAKQHIALAGMWLSRSGNAPLSIHLETQKNFRDPMRKVLEVFAIKSTRWRNIHFKLPLSMLGSMSFIKSRLPNLEMLELELWDEDTPLTKMDLFAHAPRLHTFFARDNVTKSTMVLPWNQIQVIKINSEISLSSAIDLVALAPNIENCQLCVLKYERMPAHAIVQLPTLRSLSVRIHSIVSNALFHTLCMPNIHRLSLDRSPEHHMIRDADYGKLAGKEMVQILKAAPQLQVLEVRDYPPLFISDDFLEAFSQLSPSGTPVLCPDLQTISFRLKTDCFPRDRDIVPFALALHTRGSSGTQKRLHTVTVVCTSYQAYDLKELGTSAWWGSLRDVGINLQIRDERAHAAWS